MIKPNWTTFKAKFSENPQENFEWFCYLLFCREYKKYTGIFRYKNQSAIENEPIKDGEEIIGWQAKFYGDSLSKTTCKTDVIGALEKAKRDYPSITKFVFYTNQEWGQNKGKEPQGKADVEKKANELGVKLVWNVASYFESPFVSVDSEIIAKHFFNTDKSIFDLIKTQRDHSENILNEIQTSIAFNNQNIKIDRNNDLVKIRISQEKAFILSGVGGVGKTAVIKDFYEGMKDNIPFYLFKATEFELRSISEFFTGYTFQEFLDGHKEETEKIIVIDSAEKLLDLKNTDPFKEFLTILIKENWKVIFTTRDNYLEDLNYQFFEIYKIIPLNINIQNLDITRLNSLSASYSFALPSDEKLVDLIKNPFYLNEYLKFYKEGEQINYTEFKDKLWNKIIIKSKPAREQCFLKTALQRADEGQFFITPNCESSILDELKKDGILGYESPRGYFITHDIYEEWALEKNIEVESGKKSDIKSFFQNIGSSLPMRRAFRKWLSEKLLLQDKNIKEFIEHVIKNEDIESFWKDEILVSVLLSDFSCVFFDLFKNELLSVPQKIVKYDNSSKVVQSVTVDYKYEDSLLHRIFFLIRIACKEADNDFFGQFEIKNLDVFSLKYVLTKPKGRGWECLIKFVFDNFDKVGTQNIYFILPIIHDWTSKFKEGETTKYSGLIALKCHQWTIKEDIFISDDSTKNNLLQTILYSTLEIKNELEEIFKEIIKNKWKNHRDPYNDLSEMILTKLEGVAVAKTLPKYVLQMADLFWSFTPKEDRYYSRPGIGMEEHFDMENEHLDYFPASSYQTPVYWLLQSSLQETIDFILKFTNKSVDYFAKSEFAKYEVEEVEVFVEKDKPIKQYISCRLWCTYRGTQVSPHVLESMHMALEKFFLERGKVAESKTLESWLLYLLRNSKSASISGVVASIVMAYPEKTFNIAKILFRTKDFFLYDTSRLVLDQSQKSSLLSLRTSFGINSKNEIHEEERLKACDDKHRKWHLENLFLQYQVFRNEGTSEAEVKKRQKILWEILDNYYKQLPKESEQTEADKTWRMFLARMDYRKMKPTTKKVKSGIEIHWNPEIDPKLKKESEKSLEKSSKPMKYTQLKLWANYRLGNDEKYKQYKQYEDDPKLALKEVNEIFTRLKTTKRPESLKFQHSEEENFYLFNHSIPVEVCTVMVRDYFEKLSKNESDFCVGIILEVASSSSGPSYQYQATDGAQSAISVLPILLEKFSKEKRNIKEILLFNLFNYYTVDMAGTSFNAFSIMAIHKLWKTNFDDAQSILISYLYLKPKYDVLKEKIRQENYKKDRYNFQENEVMDKFLKENKATIDKILDNQLSIDNLNNIEKIDLYTLKTAFQLIPLKTENEEHKIIVKKIISAFAEKIISNDREDRVNYKVRRDFLKQLAYFILSLPNKEISEYLKPFVDKFNSSEEISDLFEEFILAEDYLNSYENFWEVWNIFKEKVIDMCKKGDGYWNVDKIVKSYLFAQNHWKESAVEWHTLKDDNKIFFREIAEKLGHCSSALYAISKLLNDIGSSYLGDGISWLSGMLKNNENLSKAKLEVNTIYYLENLVKKYVYKNREKIQKTLEIKQNVLTILDFLINKGSVIGYMLREYIL